MIRAMIRRWLDRHRLPAIMRHGTPRDGGSGTLDLSAMPEERGWMEQASVNAEQSAWQALVAMNTGRLDAAGSASICTLRADLVTEWRATQSQQRHETREERVRRAMAEQAWSGPW